MSNRLTYKKIFVDSKYRSPQSNSSADFSVELNENLETPEGTRLYVTDISIPAVWKSTEVGFYEYIYVMVFNGDTLVKNFRYYLGNKIYFAEQLAFDINEGMNNNTTDLTAGGIFVYSYSSATRTVEFKVKVVCLTQSKYQLILNLRTMLMVFGIMLVLLMIIENQYQLIIC